MVTFDPGIKRRVKFNGKINIINPVQLIDNAAIGSMLNSTGGNSPYIQVKLFNSIRIKALCDTGNTFQDAMTAGTLLHLQSTYPQHKPQLTPSRLEKVYRVGSASGHIMDVSEAFRCSITLTSAEGLEIQFDTTVYIIPGSRSQPVNIGYHTLQRIGLVNFAQKLSTITNPAIAQIASQTEGLSPEIYIRSLLELHSIEKSQVPSPAFNKALEATFGSKPYYLQKPSRILTGDANHDDFSYAPDPDADEEPPSLEFNESPNVDRLKDMGERLKLLFQGKLHPSRSGMAAHIWQEAFEFALKNTSAFRDGLGAEPPSTLPAYCLKGRVDMNAPALEQRARPLDPLRYAYEKLYLETMTKDYRYLSPATFGKVVTGSRLHISPMLYPAKEKATRVEDVKKNSFRPCSDLRLQNLLNKHPLIYPAMSERYVQSVFDSKPTIFGSFDYDNAYFMFRLTPWTQTWFAQAYTSGVYLPSRLPQGTKDASAFVHSTILNLFEPMKTHFKCNMDDVLMHVSTDEEWLKCFKYIINLSVKHKIYLSIKKMDPYTTSAVFSGRIFTKDGSKLHPKFFRDLQTVVFPISAGKLASFLGAIRWVKPCIPAYSYLAAPLQNLLTDISRKACTSKKIVLGRYDLKEEGATLLHEQSFRKLLNAFINRIQLSFRDHTQKLIVSCDASKYGYCIFVSQVREMPTDIPIQDWGHEPLALLDGTFIDTQFGWDIVVKEAFAIQLLLRKCSHLICGEWNLFTDNEILSYLFDTSNLNLRVPTQEKLLRVGIQLMAHQVKVYHIDSEDNNVADYFSRMVEYPVDNQYKVLADIHYVYDRSTWHVDNIEGYASAIESMLVFNDEDFDLQADDDQILVVTRSQSRVAPTSVTPVAATIPAPAAPVTVALPEPVKAAKHSNPVKPVRSPVPVPVAPPVMSPVPVPVPVPVAPPPVTPVVPSVPVPMLPAPKVVTPVLTARPAQSIPVTATPVSVPNSSNRPAMNESPAPVFQHKFPLPAEMLASQRAVLETSIPEFDKVFHSKTAPLFTGTDGIRRLKYKGKSVCWIPATDKSLQLRFMILAHDGAGGHFDAKVTLKRIADQVRWHQMEESVELFIKRCLHCRRNKGGLHERRPLGAPLQGLTPNDVLYTDFLHLGESILYEGQIFNYVLIIKCSFTGYLRIYPCITCDSLAAARGLADWYTTYGSWNWLISDNGTHFKNDVIEKLCRLLKTKQHFPAPYTPHSVGAIESVNRRFLTVLRCLMGEDRATSGRWIEYIQIIEKALTERPDRTRGGLSAKELFLGISTKSEVALAVHQDSNRLALVRDYSALTNSETYQLHFTQLAHDLAEKRALATSVWHARRKERMSKQLERHGVLPSNFDLNDFVLVAHIAKDDRLHKLQANWKGPFRIIRIINPFVYEVEDLRNYPVKGKQTIHHAIRLRFYAHENEIDVTSDFKSHVEYSISMFSVSQILGHRLTDNGYEFFIKWLGLNHTENTWHSLSTMYAHAPSSMEAYLSKITEADRLAIRAQITHK